MSDLLKITGLTKQFDLFCLNDISFTLPQGFIMGLIGPNGAGKTTTIKLILNMLKKTSGNIEILGMDSIIHEKEIKEQIGVVFDNNYFADEWTMSDVEKTMGMFYKNWNVQTFYRMLERFKVDRKKRVKQLSRGMQMKLMLACAFSYNAKLLILDEPTSGLDPVSRDELLEILSDYIENGERSVLFSTHITTDLDKITDYITFIYQGRMLYSGGKDEFIDSFRIIKGGLSELTAELNHKLVGVRKFSTGFEGLIHTQDLTCFPLMQQEPATIDDIIVFTNKGV